MSPHEIKVLSSLDPKLQACALYILKHVNVKAKLPDGWRFGLFEGKRSQKRQQQLKAAGASKLSKSKHNLTPARAVDIVPQHWGKWVWPDPSQWKYWRLVGFWAEQWGKENGVKVTWGGRWGTPESARKEPADSVDVLGWDCPHVELVGWG